MNTTASCHPEAEVLNDYALGKLSTGLSVAISAHIELCQSCSEKYYQLETMAADSWSEEPLPESFAGNEVNLSNLVANIVFFIHY